MGFNDIKFSELFSSKHGKKVFKRITSLIEKESESKCDNNYIEIIFKVAFMGYFGLDDYALDRMLKDINCDKDIKDIKKIHVVSIKTIQGYIEKVNSENI